MIGPGQQPDYSTGEKIVNAIGKAIIACFVPVSLLWRKFKKKPRDRK